MQGILNPTSAPQVSALGTHRPITTLAGLNHPLISSPATYGNSLGLLAAGHSQVQGLSISLTI